MKIIVGHVLVHAKDDGRGYHGRCKHCNLALITDLGFCSWDDTECIPIEIEYESDIPKEIKSYASFRGLKWNKQSKKYVKPFGTTDDEYTLEQLNEIVKAIQIN